MQLTSTEVVRLRPGEKTEKVLQKTPICDISKPEKYDYEPDCLIGVFKHADGRKAVMLMNYRPDYTGWYNVQFKASIDKITEVDKNTGKEIKVVDDAIPMPGLQISLDAGEARLFLINN